MLTRREIGLLAFVVADLIVMTSCVYQLLLRSV